MDSKSDISISSAKFQENAVSAETAAFNERLIQILESGPRWYQVGAEKYRVMRWQGETPLPKPVVIESGRNGAIPASDGRKIPVRVFRPEPSTSQVKGVYMHIHGGGWVLQSEHYQDGLLKFIADSANLAVVSVGYRLAPEHPFPAGPNDCYDAAEWLVENAKAEYGGNLVFIGGESAGSHLSVLTAFHLIQARKAHHLRGLLLGYGIYDLSGFLPAVRHFDKPLVLDFDITEKYVMAFVPNSTSDSRRDPQISPFYADLNKLAKQGLEGRLPPALFLCGTEDCLLDDTMMMSVKWMMTGSEAIVKVFPGAPHGFTLFPPNVLKSSADAYQVMKTFMTEKLN